MNFYDRLLKETRPDRDRFLALPLVLRVLASGASRELYIAFLTQAYHHVKNTFPLLALAASRTHDEQYQSALLDYMNEERGHEKWILDDIRFIGGDPDMVSNGAPGIACRIMIGYAYYSIEHISPYALLGSIHVLEGLSVLLADQVADSLAKTLGLNASGLTYLRTHGGLDVEHVAFFERTVNQIADREAQDLIIEHVRVFYRLYGGIMDELEAAKLGQVA